MPAKTYTDNSAATTLSSAKTYADAGDAATLSSAKGYTDTQVGAEAAARAAGDIAAVASADSYTDTSVNTAVSGINTSLSGKANLSNGNIFLLGKQTLAAADTGYASLNVPAATNPPTSLSPGDVWLGNSADSHLQYQDKSNATQSIAFMSDITSADSSTLTSANGYTDTQVAAEAAARIAGDATTLASAKSYADAGDATTLSSMSGVMSCG